MKTLILTCNTGEGHNSSAYAIREMYELHGEFCEIRDSLAFLSKRISKIVGKGHAGIYKHTPKVFDKGYALSEKHDSIFAEGSVIHRFLTLGVKRLYRYVINNEIDNIICTHPFSAILATDLCEKYNLKIKTSLVSTDYTCCPGVNCSDMDIYFISHEKLVDEFLNCGIDKKKIMPSGIAVKQCFFCERNKISAREKLRLPLDKRIILMCCGSMGCGPMEKISDSIISRLNDDAMLIIICGSNTHLYNKLAEKNSDNVRIIGYTKQMCEYMEACDIFMTKPGGISTTEAASLRIPMVFIKAVAGCELRNKEFFLRNNCAVTADSVPEIIDKTMELLYDNDTLYALSENLRREFKNNGAKFIYETLKK